MKANLKKKTPQKPVTRKLIVKAADLQKMASDLQKTKS